MRILFDENFPADFAALLVGHEACIVTAGKGSTFPRMTLNGSVEGVGYGTSLAGFADRFGDVTLTTCARAFRL